MCPTEFDEGDAIDTDSQGTLILGADAIPGTAHVLRVTAGGGLGIDSTLYTLRTDDVGGGTLYVGEAAPGSSTAGAVWRIRRVVDSAGDMTVLFAAGTSSFNQIWDNHLILAYS